MSQAKNHQRRGDLANQDHEKPDCQRQNDQRDQLSFQHVTEPRSPALHRKTILPAYALLVGIQRKAKHGEREQEQWNENQGLDKSVLRYSLRPVAILRRDSQCEERQQHQQRIGRVDDPKLAAQIIKGFGFCQFVRWERVLRLSA